MPHELENIAEFYSVRRIRFDESLMRFQDRPLLLFVIHFLLHRLMKLQVLGLAGFETGALHLEQLVETQTAQQSTVAVVDIDGPQTTLTKFAQPKGYASESSHEG